MKRIANHLPVVNPNRMDSCVWNILNTLEMNLSIKKTNKKLGGAVVFWNTFTMLSITSWYIERNNFATPIPEKQNRFKLLAQARELFLNLRNAFRIDTRCALICWFAVAMSNSACIWTQYSEDSISVYTEQKRNSRYHTNMALLHRWACWRRRNLILFRTTHCQKCIWCYQSNAIKPKDIK